jgi:hypothetical protein
MLKRLFPLLLATVLLFGCGLSWKSERPLQTKEGSAPEILAFHAEQVIRPGETWRIYLKIQDIDCDMTYIIANLWQSRLGSYPVSFTPIRETGCSAITGYVFLETPADRALILDQFDVTVLVRDRDGNRSKPINLPLNFDWVSPKKPPDQWQVASVVSLGAIKINLLNSQRYDSGGK